MNTLPPMKAMPTTRCVQPGCILKLRPLSSDEVAQLVLAAVTGGRIPEDLENSEPIEAREQCIECILRVMRGCRPFLTDEEWGRLNSLGDWHRRRVRRSGYHIT